MIATTNNTEYAIVEFNKVEQGFLKSIHEQIEFQNDKLKRINEKAEAVKKFYIDREKFINENIDKEIKKRLDDIDEDIESYTLEIEGDSIFSEDYEFAITQLENEKLFVPDKARYYLEHEFRFMNKDLILYKPEELEIEITRTQSEIKRLNEDMERFYIDVRKNREEKERELMKMELMKPKSTSDVYIDVQQFIEKEVYEQYGDIYDYYYGLITNSILSKVTNGEDYSKTIDSVLNEKCTRSFGKMFENHNEEIINACNLLLKKFVDELHNKSLSIDELDLICSELEKRFKHFIDNHFSGIAEYLRKKTLRVSNMVNSLKLESASIVKNAARDMVGALTKSLKQDVEITLRKNFNDYLECLNEELRYQRQSLNLDVEVRETPKGSEDQRAEEIVNVQPVIEEVEEVEETPMGSEAQRVEIEPVIIKQNIYNSKPNESVNSNKCFSNWLASLQSTPYVLQNLTDNYNEFFNLNLSSKSFSQLNEIRNAFSTSRKTINKKKCTIYTKI